MQRILIVTIMALLLCSAPAIAAVQVEMQTSAGNIVLELDDEKAPITVANFLKYAEQGFYDGTIFHRVIKGFMIQGGGFDTSKKRKPTMAPIKNEANNGLRNLRGTIAMARTRDIDSATSQFFINHNDNQALDHMVRDYGYAVFGRVISGMEVVDRIAATPISRGAGPFASMPTEMMVIKSVKKIAP